MSEDADIRQRFRCLEEMAARLRHWDTEFNPLAVDHGGSELTQVALGPLLLTQLETNCPHRHRGASPPSGETFGLLADGAQTVHWCRQRLAPQSLTFFEARQEFEASAHPRFSAFTLTVDTGYLASDPLWQPLLRRLRRPGTGRRGIHLANPRAVQRLRGRLAATLGALANGYLRDADPGAARGLGEQIVGDLRLALEAADPSTERSSAWARARAVKRAQDYLQNHPHDPVSLPRLGAIANVSERTLQRAFLEHFGVSPKAYTRILRLNEIRADLLGAETGEVLVKDLAIARGFWHMGQFSRDYKGLFGELPSQTLGRRADARLGTRNL